MELKPCPFCGMIPTRIDIDYHLFRGYVSCGKCEATGPVVLNDGHKANDKKIRATWNKRAPTRLQHPLPETMPKHTD